MKTLRKALIGLYANIGYIMIGMVLVNVIQYVFGFNVSIDSIISAIFSTLLAVILIVVVAFIAAIFAKEDELKEVEAKYNSRK